MTKINRAKKISAIGPYHRTFYAMLGHVPADLIKTMTSRQLAAVIDALYRASQDTRSIGYREAIES